MNQRNKNQSTSIIPALPIQYRIFSIASNGHGE